MATRNSGPGSGSGDGEQETKNSNTNAEVERYWTPERRAKAQGRVYEPAGTLAERVGTREQREEERQHEGWIPQGQDPPEASIVQVTAGPPFEVSDRDIDFPPYVKIGKLYFTAGKNNYTGSACVIGRDLLLTAAHNLYLNNEWSRNILFIPAAWDNRGRFGEWYYDTAVVDDIWYNNQKLNGYDVGLVRLRKGGLDPQRPRSIGDVVGRLGYIYGGDPRNRSWRDVGYPGNYDDARRMYAQNGDFTRELDQGTVVGMTGRLIDGISGGPWLYYSQNQVSVYGLHSFHYPGQEEVYSPYFASWVDRFIQRHS